MQVFPKDFQGLVARAGKAPGAARSVFTHVQALSESVDSVWVPPAYPLPLCHSRRKSHCSYGGRGVIALGPSSDCSLIDDKSN